MQEEVGGGGGPHLQSSVNAVFAHVKLFAGAVAGTAGISDNEHGTSLIHCLRLISAAFRGIAKHLQFFKDLQISILQSRQSSADIQHPQLDRPWTMRMGAYIGTWKGEGGRAECTSTRDALSAKSPWTTSTPRFASTFALSLSGLRVTARTAAPCLSSESTAEPP